MINISNCKICGRKTQIVAKLKPQSGKWKGWTKITHRCEMHGNDILYVGTPKKGVES